MVWDKKLFEIEGCSRKRVVRERKLFEMRGSLRTVPVVVLLVGE